MRKRTIVFLTLPVVLVGLGFLGLWLLGYALSHPTPRVEPLGGSWQLRIWESPMDHSGGEANLERKGPQGAVKVAELVQLSQYMGDDCVLYETSAGQEGPHVLAVCGDRSPWPVTPAGYDDWRLLPDGLQHFEWIGDEKKPTRKIPWTEIRARALAQPRAR